MASALLHNHLGRMEASNPRMVPPSSRSSTANTQGRISNDHLNVINPTGASFSESQVHPIFAVSPASGITYSWVSPPKSLPRKRTVFTRRQRTELESKFQAQKYISKSERIRFARELGLKDSQVRQIFWGECCFVFIDLWKLSLCIRSSNTCSSLSYRKWYIHDNMTKNVVIIIIISHILFLAFRWVRAKDHLVVKQTLDTTQRDDEGTHWLHWLLSCECCCSS